MPDAPPPQSSPNSSSHQTSSHQTAARRQYSRPLHISDERKTIFYVGMALSLLGLLLFLSTFLGFALNFGTIKSMALSAFGGMILMMIGGACSAVGRLGAAGSGMLLDPEQAEKDLAPWARLSGRLTNKTVGEIEAIDGLIDGLSKVGSGASGDGATVREVIKVRCQACETLNDEDAKFCDQCGAEM